MSIPPSLPAPIDIPNQYPIRSNDSHQLLVPDTLGQILSFLPVYQRATCKAVCTTFNEVVNQDEECTAYPSDIKKSAERIYKSIEKNIHALEEECYNQPILLDSQYRIDHSRSRGLSILTNKQGESRRKVTTLATALQGTPAQDEAQFDNSFLLNIKLADEQSTRSQIIQSVHQIAFSILRICTDILCGMTIPLGSIIDLTLGHEFNPGKAFLTYRKFLDEELLTLLQMLRVYFVGKKTLTFTVELRRPSHTQDINVDGEQQRDLPLAIFTSRDNKVFIDGTLRYLNNTLLSNLEEMEKADRNLQDIRLPKNIDEIHAKHKFLDYLERLQARDTNTLIKANSLVDQYKKAITRLQEIDGSAQIDENMHQAYSTVENYRKDMLERNSIIIEELEYAEKMLSELESLIPQTV